MTHAGQSWETQELLRWLNSDRAFLHLLRGKSAEEIRQAVWHENAAPDGFYRIFSTQPHPGDYAEMDWNDIADRIQKTT